MQPLLVVGGKLWWEFELSLVKLCELTVTFNYLLGCRVALVEVSTKCENALNHTENVWIISLQPTPSNNLAVLCGINPGHQTHEVSGATEHAGGSQT